MNSNDLVKSVAKKLKYYFEVKRLEDGFDLSDVHQPMLDHPPLKVRPAMQYQGLHDRALKHYFSQPEVRVQLTQMNGANGKGPLYGRREVQVRKMLDNYMRHYNFQKTALPPCYYVHCNTKGKGCNLKPEVTGVLRRSKRDRLLKGGWPTLRSVPEPHISKGEASRLVNSATKLLVATIPKPSQRYEECTLCTLIQQGSRRPVTASYATRRKRVVSAKPKAYDDIYLEQRSRQHLLPRPRSPTPSQSSKGTTNTTSTATTASTSTVTEDKPVQRPRSSKYRSRTIINAVEPRPQEEVAIIRSTQTVADYDVGLETDRQLLEKYDQLEEEVRDGPWCEYQIYVCTGTRIGSSTKAKVRLTIFGEKGRTKEFTLTESTRHKIPFQKGREDCFILAAHHVGKMRKIKIGHDRPELSYAWFLEGVTVYDTTAKRIYQFPCERWLSGQDGDKRTYRTLQVDRERAFLEALSSDEGTTYLKHNYTSDSGSSNAHTEDRRYPKKKDDFSTQVQPGVASSTDSETESDSASTSSGSSRARIAVNDQGLSPRRDKPGKKADKPQVKDDFDEKAKTGTVITFHSASDPKAVDEIFLDPRGQDAKTKVAEEYMQGFKDAVTANETQQKKRLEREREMERQLLQGKSIHDAVRDGDFERVKDLLHSFPEMRDFRDESSWTPLHLAAARGNIELLRWLVTSDADINAETSTGYNAMHIAAMNGHVNSMMLLQAMGSSIFGLTAEKQSALHLAAKSGHLECVKWLVANRASLVAEDNFGRSPVALAEQFGHEACTDFLRICLRELSNPRSTFAMMHGRRISGGLPPIEEDAASASSGNPWKDDVKGHGDSDSEGEETKKKRTAQEEAALEEKRRVYTEQHQRMEDRGVSFLDSIRQEVDS